MRGWKKKKNSFNPVILNCEVANISWCWSIEFFLPSERDNKKVLRSEKAFNRNEMSGVKRSRTKRNLLIMSCDIWAALYSHTIDCVLCILLSEVKIPKIIFYFIRSRRKWRSSFLTFARQFWSRPNLGKLK